MDQFSVPVLGKILIVIGLVIALAGVIVLVSGKLPVMDKLPGGIVIRVKNATFFFPVVTMIILSIVLTLILNLFLRK